jgi:hypothetical protein
MIKHLLATLSKGVDDPHEKIIYVLLIIAVFSFMHYGLFLQNRVHYRHENIKQPTYEHFLWYSLTLTLTIPLGDVYPESPESKILSSIQAMLFWMVMLA